MEPELGKGCRVEVVISGRVQRVGYRYFVIKQAQALGLGGYVRNLPSGAVEVVAEGERMALERLLGLLRRGPTAARVESMEVEWGVATGEFASFGVRY